MFFNIEKSAFNRGEYVGYSGGARFKIRRGMISGWKALQVEQGANSDRVPAGALILYGRTLRELSAKLAANEPQLAAQTKANYLAFTANNS
jgi:hypothetical protein